MFFRLLFGIHVEYGIMYNAGDVFYSGYDYAAEEPDKYRSISELEFNRVEFMHISNLNEI